MVIKPLEYGTGLNLKEANERYTELVEEFERIKKKYPESPENQELKEEDGETLSACIGVILPLGLEKAVQEEVRQENIISEDTLHYKLSELESEILMYMSKFENSGIKMVGCGMFPL